VNDNLQILKLQCSICS